MVTIKQEGKRFSRRTVKKHETEDGTLYFECFRWDDHLTANTIERYRLRATETLKMVGIDVATLREASRSASMVQDYVLNCKGLDPDSQQGLAARILCAIADLEFRKTTGLAFHLGRLTMLFDTYEVDGTIQSARRKGKPLVDRYDTSRNARLKRFHAGLIADGTIDATKQTASEFGITERQVRNILKITSGNNPETSGA